MGYSEDCFESHFNRRVKLTLSDEGKKIVFMIGRAEYKEHAMEARWERLCTHFAKMSPYDQRKIALFEIMNMAEFRKKIRNQLYDADFVKWGLLVVADGVDLRKAQ